jgi:hypothetical protein
VPHLRVFDHQAKAGDAVIDKMLQVALDTRHVAAAEQAGELDPADRVVLADRGPGRAALVDEVWRVRCHADPRQDGSRLIGMGGGREGAVHQRALTRACRR